MRANLIECRAGGFYGHFEGETETYGAAGEIEHLKEAHDLLDFFRTDAAAAGLEKEQTTWIDAEVVALLDGGDRRGARGSRAGRPRAADGRIPKLLGVQMPRTLTYSEAINEALEIEMSRDETVGIFGEDIAGESGSPGQYDAWGGSSPYERASGQFPYRSSICPSPRPAGGAAAGAAVSGPKPVVEAMSQRLHDDMRRSARQPGGEVRCMFAVSGHAVVVRTTYGAGQQTAAQHPRRIRDVRRWPA